MEYIYKYISNRKQNNIAMKNEKSGDIKRNLKHKRN